MSVEALTESNDRLVVQVGNLQRNQNQNDNSYQRRTHSNSRIHSSMENTTSKQSNHVCSDSRGHRDGGNRDEKTTTNLQRRIEGPLLRKLAARFKMSGMKETSPITPDVCLL